jgi:predicted DNA-binding transcriptional regulator YafY
MSMAARKGDGALQAALAALPPAAMDSVWLGALLCERLADRKGEREARRILDALEAIRAATLELTPVPPGEAGLPPKEASAVTRMTHAAVLKDALEQERRLAIGYRDGKGRATSRVVWPLAVEDYGPNGAMFAWCETRRDFRNFRFDRIVELEALPDRAAAPRRIMLAYHAALAGEEDFDGEW